MSPFLRRKKPGPERKGALPGVKEEINKHSQVPTFRVRPPYNSNKLQRGISNQLPAIEATLKKKKIVPGHRQQHFNGKRFDHLGLLSIPPFPTLSCNYVQLRYLVTRVMGGLLI